MAVYNELKEVLASDGNAGNNDSLLIESVAAGTVLEVQVLQKDGTGG